MISWPASERKSYSEKPSQERQSTVSIFWMRKGGHCLIFLEIFSAVLEGSHEPSNLEFIEYEFYVAWFFWVSTWVTNDGSWHVYNTMPGTVQEAYHQLRYLILQAILWGKYIITSFLGGEELRHTRLPSVVRYQEVADSNLGIRAINHFSVTPVPISPRSQSTS